MKEMLERLYKTNLRKIDKLHEDLEYFKQKDSLYYLEQIARCEGEIEVFKYNNSYISVILEKG